MEKREQRERDGGGDRPVSSYASLASGPVPSYVSRNDPLSPGGRGFRRGGRGDDRSASSFDHRGGRGGGRGRGRSSFRRRGGGFVGGGGRSDRTDSSLLESSNDRSSSVAEERPITPPDLDEKSVNSGYESGEISLSALPPKRIENRYLEENRFDRRDRDGPGRYGVSDHREGRRGSSASQERPPYESSSGGRGRRFGGSGGRSRGGFGRGGMSEYEGRGRQTDFRSSFRADEGAFRADEVSIRDSESELPFRDQSARSTMQDLLPRDYQSRDRNASPRDLPLRDAPERAVQQSDLEFRKRSFRDASRDGFRPRDDRYDDKRPLGSYTSILKEKEFRRPSPLPEESFSSKRRREEDDFQLAARTESRSRSIENVTRGRHLPSNLSRPQGPRDRLPSEESFREPTRNRDRTSFRGRREDNHDDRSYRENFLGADGPLGRQRSLDFRRPLVRPTGESERMVEGPTFRRNLSSGNYTDIARTGSAPSQSRAYQRADHEAKSEFGSTSDVGAGNGNRPPQRLFVDDALGPVENDTRSPPPAQPLSMPLSRRHSALDELPALPSDGSSFSNRGTGRGGGYRGRGGRGFRGGGRGRSDYGRFGPKNDFASNNSREASERDNGESDRKSWNRSEDIRPSPKFVPRSAMGPSFGSYAGLADNLPSFASMAENEVLKKEEVADSQIDNPSETEDTNAKSPPLSPPPEGSPSGVVKAFVRLAELEASMEYAFAKHMMLVKKRKDLRAQRKILENLPIGIEAIQEDLQTLQAV